MVFVYKNPLHESGDDSFAMDEKGHVSSPHGSDFQAVASRDVESLDLDEVESAQPVQYARLRYCCRWTCWLLLALTVATAAVCLAAYLGPILLEKVIVPIMGWEVAHLSKPVMAVVAVTCLALLPLVFLPTGPTMWVVGILFGYLRGFPLLYFGVFLGQTLPYFIGHWVLHERIQRWLSQEPRHAALLKMAEQGGWMHQFRVVVLLRMSPFPYAFFNYAITATNIAYGPYIIASMVAQIPECLLAIYCGRLIKTLADFHKQQQRRLTPLEMASQGIGLLIALSIAALGMFYGNRALRKLEEVEAVGGVVEVGGPRSGPLGYRLSRTRGGEWLGGGGVLGGLSWGKGEGGKDEGGQILGGVGGGGGEEEGVVGKKGGDVEGGRSRGVKGGGGEGGEHGLDQELELFSVDLGEGEGGGGEVGDRQGSGSGFGGSAALMGEGVRGLLGMGKEGGTGMREGKPLLREDGTGGECFQGGR